MASQKSLSLEIRSEVPPVISMRHRNRQILLNIDVWTPCLPAGLSASQYDLDEANRLNTPWTVMNGPDRVHVVNVQYLYHLYNVPNPIKQILPARFALMTLLFSLSDSLPSATRPMRLILEFITS